MLNFSFFFSFILFFYLYNLSLSVRFPIHHDIEYSEKSEKNRTIEITSYKQYQEYIKKNEYVISVFHMNWCGHCRHFLPIFDTASSYKKTRKWTFLKIACSNYTKICDKLNIDRYPSIKVYVKGKLLEYSVPRELPTLLEFLTKITSNPLVEIKNNNIEEFYKNYGNNLPVVEYESKDSKFYKCLEKLANEKYIPLYYFGVKQIESNGEDPEKILFEFDETTIPFIWQGNCEKVDDFLYNNVYPILTKVNSAFFRELSQNPRIAVILFGSTTNTKVESFITEDFYNLAKNNRQLVFSFSDFGETKSKSLLNYFHLNLTNDNELGIVFYDFGLSLTYVHDRIFNIKEQTNDEIIVSIKDLIKNVDNLKFTSGSKFNDFMRNIGLDKITGGKQIVILLIITAILVMFFTIPAFCDKGEDEKEKEKKTENKEVKNDEGTDKNKEKGKEEKKDGKTEEKKEEKEEDRKAKKEKKD